MGYMGLLRTESLSSNINQADKGKVLIEAKALSVKYIVGSRREDIQSLAYNALFRRRPKEDFWALQSINFTGHAGDIIGIIGANGAGKTTLCRVISGLLRPDEGKISINGSVSALLALGAGFNPQLSGRENIFINGMMMGLSKKECQDLSPKIVQFSGLDQFIDQPVKHYSSGMKARLGFSVAVMLEPEILVIDEALSVGDLEFNEKAARKMQDIVANAKMVFVVTHQIGFVEKHCTRALWIDRGSVRASGNPDEIASLYKASIKQSAKSQKPVSIELRHTEPQSGTTKVINVKNLGIKFYLYRQSKVSHSKEDMKKLLFTQKRKPFWALKDVSFSIKEGDIVGIIGPNGAGKTTLCQVLSGILKPDKGQVFVAGESTALLSIGTGFNDQLTGKDNIFLNGMMLGIPKNKLVPLYKDIVEFSELERFMDKPIKYYSSGMRSRLGFSIAAMIKPDVFIIDEALSVGDANFYEKASLKIQELIGIAKVVVVVTHSMGFVEKVCTRAIWIKNGVVQIDGSPKEALAMYHQSLISNNRT